MILTNHKLHIYTSQLCNFSVKLFKFVKSFCEDTRSVHVIITNGLTTESQE